MVRESFIIQRNVNMLELAAKRRPSKKTGKSKMKECAVVNAQISG